MHFFIFPEQVYLPTFSCMSCKKDKWVLAGMRKSSSCKKPLTGDILFLLLVGGSRPCWVTAILWVTACNVPTAHVKVHIKHFRSTQND